MEIGQGMQTGLNNVFGEKSLNDLKLLHVESKYAYRRARNSDIEPFFVKDLNEYLIFIEDVNEFSALPKQLQSFLERNKKELQERAACIRGNCKWWKFTWPLSKEFYNRKRIICPYLSTFNRFALVDNENILSLTDTTVIFENNQKEDLQYILGLLNSDLLTFRFRSIGKMKGGGVLEYFWNSIKKIPIKRINFKNKEEKDIHDKIVFVVSQLIKTKSDQNTARTDKDKTFNQHKLESLTKTLNDHVYALYQISNEEQSLIMIVNMKSLALNLWNC